MKSHPLRTTVIGSYPFPGWLEFASQNLDRSSSPMAAAYREKLTLLDSGIAELKATVENNRYNTYLQIELASLYQQKQQTLQEWLQNANHN